MVFLSGLQVILVFIVFVLVLYDHYFKFVEVVFQVVEIIGTCQIVCINVRTIKD